MIKNPITKTGEIRYLELIKISVLVSFFYALLSFLTDDVIQITSSTVFISSLVANILVIVLISAMCVVELIELWTIVKSFIMFVTIKPIIFVKKSINWIKNSVSEYTNRSYKTLCVIRC